MAEGGCDAPECPLWVKSGHWSRRQECPLYPRKRTFSEAVQMSAKCQMQTCNPTQSVVVECPSVDEAPIIELQTHELASYGSGTHVMICEVIGPCALPPTWNYRTLQSRVQSMCWSSSAIFPKHFSPPTIVNVSRIASFTWEVILLDVPLLLPRPRAEAICMHTFGVISNRKFRPFCCPLAEKT